MSSIAIPDKLREKVGEIRCACVDRASGAVWMGTASGALTYQPATGAWAHVRLKGEAIESCGPGSRGVWLASREHLIWPEPSGAGVRRFRIADATGTGARVTGVAADRGGTWLVVDGLDGPAPSLLRLPDKPPVFQRWHVKIGRLAARAFAVAGDGERAWALGPSWLVELTPDALVRPGHLPETPAAAQAVYVPTLNVEDQLAAWVTAMSPACWLRVRDRGLVGRNEQGVFVLPHGGTRPGCPQLPGRLDLFATDWLGVDGAMLMASPLGLFVSTGKNLSVIAPGEEIVALIDGATPVAITRHAIHTAGPAARAAAPRVSLPLDVVARELALLRVLHPAATQRVIAAKALVGNGSGGEREAAALEVLLADGVAEVRTQACLTLGALQPPGVKVLLGRMMADPATSVQAAAAQALKWC